MVLAESPRQAAEQAAGICFSMVTDSTALAAVARGENGIIAGLSPKSVYVDMSTVSPLLIEELATEVSRVGASMLDSPVSGSVAHARSGRLSFMVGGDPYVLEAVKPVLLAFGEKATWVGPNGRGTLMKLATNLQVYVQTLAFAESMRLAERGGIERKVAMEVLLNSVIASPMLAYRAPFMVEKPAQAWFNIDLTVKDLGYALDAGRRLGASLPTTEITAQVYAEAARMGLGAEEMAAIYTVIDRLGAVAPPIAESDLPNRRPGRKV